MANSVEYLYTAKMGLATFSTANVNLDGTGSLTQIITGATNGTLVKALIIKAQSNTTAGMIRFYTQKAAGNKMLQTEVYVPPVTKSSRDASFSYVISMNSTLENGEVLWVSTQNPNTFNVVVEAFDISFSTTAAYLGSTCQYIVVAGSDKVTTANSNLDGSGAIVKIIQAGSSPDFNGCVITSIKIKAQQTTTPGMVRLFIQDSSGSTTILFNETEVPSTIQSATTKTFGCEVIGSGSICIPPGYSIFASTENAEKFSIIIDAANWKYV